MKLSYDLHYTIRGEGPPLILVMGLGADGSAWEKHVESYSKCFTCYLLDNRGVGQSPQPEGPYSTAAMADDIAKTMELLRLDAAPVAGISMGGAIAQELALRHPHLVSRLLLVSSWARCSTYMKAVFQHFETIRPLIPQTEFVRLLQLWIWTPDYFNENCKELSGAADSADQIASSQSDFGFSGQCSACREHDAVSRLGEISVPTLVTVGDADIFTPIECSALLCDLIPNARLSVYANGGHVHHWEMLDRFNSESTAFLLGDE